MRFQRLTQAIGLALFVGMLLTATYPLSQGLTVDFFLTLDPLISVGTMLAQGTLVLKLLPGVIVVASGLLFGRVFCGHICPMGTTLDIIQAPLLKGKKQPKRTSSFEATAGFRNYKYLILIFTLAAGLVGVSLVFIGSPLSLVTRFYSLCAYPVLLLLGDTALSWTADPLYWLGLDSMALLHVPLKVFATNIFVALLFTGIAGLAYFQPRFWCRNLCPAGALLGFASRRPLIRRRVDESCTECGACVRMCPTGAISSTPSETAYSECIVCLKCTEVCPEDSVSFSWKNSDTGVTDLAVNPTRRGIVTSLGIGLVYAGLLRTSLAQPIALTKERAYVDPHLIRPPGAIPEPDFLSACVRCGECMKACPTTTLQPIWLKAGLEGIFSPIMTPRLGACATGCNVCGQVCPTCAIRPLSLIEKNHAKVGTAYVVRENCWVWEQDKKCLVCDEACPYNAVSFRPVPGRRNPAPFVIENQCTGCGWCETRCPVEGAAAIRVNIVDQVRLASGSYVQKARELGLVFKTRDNTQDRLAPGTFDNQGSEYPKPLEKESIQKPNEELPPGFVDK